MTESVCLAANDIIHKNGMDIGKGFAIEELLLLLNHKYCRHSIGWVHTKLYELTAPDFLAFAKQDLEEDNLGSRVSALSNAKRAIECRADEILTLLNLVRVLQKLGLGKGIPAKLMAIRSLDIPAPDVLKEFITQKRNTLEHEYSEPPEWKQISQMVEVAGLFLAATDPIVKRGHLRSISFQRRSNVRVISETRDRKRTEYDGEQTVFEFGLGLNEFSSTSFLRHGVEDWRKNTGEIRVSNTPKVEYGKASYDITNFDGMTFRELIKSLHLESAIRSNRKSISI